MDDWVQETRSAAGPCPACGALAARPIVYGLPSAQDAERLEGKVVFAGSCEPGNAAAYSCGVCGQEWR